MLHLIFFLCVLRYLYIYLQCYSHVLGIRNCNYCFCFWINYVGIISEKPNEQWGTAALLHFFFVNIHLKIQTPKMHHTNIMKEFYWKNLKLLNTKRHNETSIVFVEISVPTSWEVAFVSKNHFCKKTLGYIFLSIVSCNKIDYFQEK